MTGASVHPGAHPRPNVTGHRQTGLIPCIQADTHAGGADLLCSGAHTTRMAG
jgi:hypothetical protein